MFVSLINIFLPETKQARRTREIMIEIFTMLNAKRDLKIIYYFNAKTQFMIGQVFVSEIIFFIFISYGRQTYLSKV